MASIRDFLTGKFWKIDENSQAGRVTLYDTSGNPLTGTEDSDQAISLSALSATASIEMSGHNTCGIVITNLGHANNVLTVEVTLDNSTWVSIPIVDISTNNSVATITAAGSYGVPMRNGVQSVRVRMSSYTSGTCTGNISAVYAQSQHFNIRTYDNVLSIVNSTNAQLAAGATFTGVWEADLFWQGITCNVFADQPLTITIEQSLDGSTVTKSDSWTYNASSTGRDATKSVNLISNYHRIKITNNGAGATTTLNFNMYSCPNFTAMPVSQTSSGAMPVEIYERATYRSSVTNFTPVATLTFSLKGSSTRVVRVTRIGFSATNSSLNTADVTVKKYSNIATGTPASLTMVPLDSSSSAATALAQSWSVTPGTQTSVGTIETVRYNEPTTGNNNYITMAFGDSQRGTSAIVLRGTSEWVGVDISSVANNPVFDIWIEWIEE